jgi:hypothetical protein
MLEEFSLLAFSAAKLFLIGVDWCTSELVKWQLSEETLMLATSLIHLHVGILCQINVVLIFNRDDPSLRRRNDMTEKMFT